MNNRIKWFPATLPAHALELDEHGIPAIAYWNTKSDWPIKAKKLTHVFAIEVEYTPDQAK